jgi:two-component system cell cycle sensor histidine kinase/response regulator CckA
LTVKLQKRTVWKGTIKNVLAGKGQRSMSTTLGKTTKTSDRELQSELRNLLLTQKTDLIGELAQAMANQFNNIMMAVTSYAELELKKASEKDRHGLQQVLTHANRATSLIQKLLAFSRKHAPEPQQLELNAIITDISALLKELLGEQAELTLRLDANGEIQADRVDVEQTLFALVIIARDAMDASGKLAISTAIAELDQTFIGSNDDAAPGKYVVLSVENKGASSSTSAGLDQTEKINLSLAAVRGIVKDCRGLARLSIQPGAGSSFRLYFPVSTSSAVDEEGPTLPRNPAVARTILVVEDDDAVRMPAAEFLMMEGFKVLQARTGNEALNLVQQSRSSLDVLVTDIYMPKMSGHEVAVLLLEQHPLLKVLYISGDPGRQASAASDLPGSATLRKPFRLNILRD